jgi:hypothetical protein
MILKATSILRRLKKDINISFSITPAYHMELHNNRFLAICQCVLCPACFLLFWKGKNVVVVILVRVSDSDYVEACI